MDVYIPRPLRTELAPPRAQTPWLTGRGTRWMVSEDWRVCIDGDWYTVPAGYIFDGASIPWWLWWLFPPTYRPAFEASCFHDICYSHWWRVISKEFADDAFRSIMLHRGASPAVAGAFYRAVSWFGKGGW